MMNEHSRLNFIAALLEDMEYRDHIGDAVKTLMVSPMTDADAIQFKNRLQQIIAMADKNHYRFPRFGCHCDICNKKEQPYGN